MQRHFLVKETARPSRWLRQRYKDMVEPCLKSTQAGAIHHEHKQVSKQANKPPLLPPACHDFDPLSARKSPATAQRQAMWLCLTQWQVMRHGDFASCPRTACPLLPHGAPLPWLEAQAAR